MVIAANLVSRRCTMAVLSSLSTCVLAALLTIKMYILHIVAIFFLLTWRNLWLPSSTRINLSVRLSVRHRPNRFGQLFFKS